MNTPPDFALRYATVQGQRWALGHAGSHWSALAAGELLDRHLDEALARLATHPDGLLVGLLPYPDAPRRRDERLPPARLMLCERFTVSDSLPDPGAATFRLSSPFTADVSREQYVAAVRRVQDYLAAGDAYQVNLSQRFTATYAGDPWRAFTGLARQFDPPHAAWIRDGHGAVMSLSPELFLRGDRTHVETHPIKGTRPRHPAPETDTLLAQELARHPKDRAENLMIVDLLRNDFGKVCIPGSVKVPDLFRIESQPNVHHLVSTITGTLRAGLALKDLLIACFPGGSITGAPKTRAMEIIDELEAHARSVYCGTVFWVTADGRFGSNILIRTFLASEGVLHAWAGAGIVADSIPESEYAECLDKMRPLMGFLERPI